jgi:3-hydroxybutyryl-CoA dehydrogenase
MTGPIQETQRMSTVAQSGITTVGIIGAGTMGSGIATALAAHGADVRLLDQDAARAAAAVADARTFFARNAEKGRMTVEAAAAAGERVAPVSDMAALDSVDLVIEAVFEDFDLKASLFERLSGVVPATTLIATNTSCLRVDDLARHVSHPERFLGLHFFSPAAINPVVEVVSGAATAPAIADQALAFCAAAGKRPIPCRDMNGFAINRFFCPYTNEAVRLMDEGLGDPALIDQAAKLAIGAGMGPFAVMNIIKPRINLHAIRNLAPLGAFYAPADGMVRQGESDQPWPIEDRAIAAEAVPPVLVDRLRAGVFLPVLQLLDDDVADAAAIDQGAAMALRFGEPPCQLMDRLGAAAVGSLIQPLLTRYGAAAPRSLERVGRLLA